MKTFRLWNYDTDASVEREARSAEKAVEEYALETDEGDANSANIGVEVDGEWRRYNVRFHREVRVEVGHPRAVKDPRPPEE